MACHHSDSNGTNPSMSLIMSLLKVSYLTKYDIFLPNEFYNFDHDLKLYTLLLNLARDLCHK